MAKKKKIKLLEINPDVFRQYQTEVSGNEEITYEMARKKFTRNMILGLEEYNPYHEEHDGGTLYRYGYMQFIVRNNTVIWFKAKGLYPKGWMKDHYLYEELNQKLGIS